jgi:DNA-binding PadR family transcriptional regulator
MFGTFVFGMPDRHGCSEDRHRWTWTGGFDGKEWFGHRGRHRRGRAGRMFEQGDLKYVILRLLEEKPRHGYEVIKELEDRFGGAYSPSPGTVYPTLTMLEDMGYARATQEEGGRKIYSVTPEGSAYLKEHSTTVDSIFQRIAEFMEGFLDKPMMDVTTAARRVARSAFAQASRNVNDKAKLERIREVLARAAAELEEMEKGGG